MFKATILGSRSRLTSTAPLLSLVRLVAECYRRAASRRQLGELDARLLRDIGLSREAALQEARKPFWRM